MNVDSPFTGHSPFNCQTPVNMPSPFKTDTSKCTIGFESSIIKFGKKNTADVSHWSPDSLNASSNFQRKKVSGDEALINSGNGSRLTEKDSPAMMDVNKSEKSKLAPPKDEDEMMGEEDERVLP